MGTIRGACSVRCGLARNLDFTTNLVIAADKTEAIVPNNRCFNLGDNCNTRQPHDLRAERQNTLGQNSKKLERQSLLIMRLASRGDKTRA